MAGEVGMHIRPEDEDDEDAIRSLLQSAFEGSAEADLVDALRWQGDLAVSLVADVKGRLVGHVALSPLRSPHRSLALAPLAVSPQMQGMGIGTALVREALNCAAHRDAAIVFVLGEPEYYSRFGFNVRNAQLFPSVYSGDHFMAHWLGADRVPSAPVLYAQAFEGLSG